MKILAIETSCDETSISILDNGKILANIISSQIDTHKKYGGVVPEIASRLHYENFGYVLEEAIKKANISFNDLNYIAYTKNPGLIGCLHIGKIIAKTLSSYLDIPLIPCNHIEGHIYSAAINQKWRFPILFLVVSGGHTQLVLLKDDLDFNVLGTTLDDAVGEAYDKVGRLLGYNYPAGPIIDKNYYLGKNNFDLPMPKNDDTLDFSFSGIKSACANIIGKNKNNANFNKLDFCTSFQETIVKILIKKINMATKKYQPKIISVVGGVSANSLLRKKVLKYCKINKIECILPKLEYCTDNAAMIAMLAYKKILKEKREF